MDINTITAAYTGLKSAKEILLALLRLKIKTEVQTQVGEVLDKLGQAQDTLFAMREELFRLQSENSDLRKQVEAQHDWEQRLSQYKLETTEGGAVVFRSKTSLQHYVCPSCVEKRQIQILQTDRNMAQTFSCPACECRYPVGKMKDLPREPRRQSKYPFVDR